MKSHKGFLHLWAFRILTCWPAFAIWIPGWILAGIIGGGSEHGWRSLLGLVVFIAVIGAGCLVGERYEGWLQRTGRLERWADKLEIYG